MHKLRELLEKQPDDPFLLYALAMEHRARAEYPAALEHLGRVIEKDPGYIAAYHMSAQTHMQAGNREAARRAYATGIEAAKGKGDSHAAQEMQGELDLI